MATSNDRGDGGRTWRQALVLALVAGMPRVTAASEIYRCEVPNGPVLFQDRPCNQTDGVRPAPLKSGSGVRLHLAPPPAEAGEVAMQRYRRYLAQAEQERREQAAADQAAAARLRAEAALAAAEREPDSVAVNRCEDPEIAQREPRCQRPWSTPNTVYYPVFIPVQPPQHRPPPRGPSPGPRPTRPPAREPRDPRAEILDTRR
jgi:hypothetical protein